MVFLDILLNGLYELPLAEEDRMCIAHPTKKQHMVRNEITDYAADMGMLLAYYKLLDDGEDEGSKLASSRALLLKKHAGAIGVRWPEQAEAVRQYIVPEGITAAEDAFEECRARIYLNGEELPAWTPWSAENPCAMMYTGDGAKPENAPLRAWIKRMFSRTP